MSNRTIYRYRGDFLLDKKEIKRFFKISEIDIKLFSKMKTLKPISVEGKVYYKLTNVLKASGQMFNKQLLK